LERHRITKESARVYIETEISTESKQRRALTQSYYIDKAGKLVNEISESKGGTIGNPLGPTTAIPDKNARLWSLEDPSLR
jgi:hypothetical protein